MVALSGALRELVAQGHAVVVVGWKPDRLFRDVEAKASYYRQWARLGKIDGEPAVIVQHNVGGLEPAGRNAQDDVLGCSRNG
jgi:hypothetical protein